MFYLFDIELDYQQDINPKEKALAWTLHDGNKPLNIINNELYRFTLIKCSDKCHIFS